MQWNTFYHGLHDAVCNFSSVMEYKTHMKTKVKNMRHISNKLTTSLLCMALCGALTACGHKEPSQVQSPEQTETQNTEAEPEIRIDTQTGSRPDQASAQQGDSTGAPADSDQGTAGYLLIKEQTFDVTLEPLGSVTFSSYEPDSRQNPLADVLFEIKKAGKTVCLLDGVYEDNIRSNETFNKVEAVSFPDYNNDGFNDIIIICSYSPASGPETGTGYPEVRIYSGKADGSFTLERNLSENANSALAEKTIQSVLGFLGTGKGGTKVSASGWKQAYIDLLQSQDSGQWQGYNLIYINDDAIPELVEIGIDEATGCNIVSFADGAADETQLSRLSFSYIERGNLLCNSEGNMDCYYDIVYSMESGRLIPIASGYYGAEDNSNVQFDDEGNPIYQYDWEGVMMTQEEYNQAFQAVYDRSSEKPGYEWDKWFSLEGVIQAIGDIQ